MSSAALKFLKVLSDPTRLRILELLTQAELNVAELCEVLALPQPTVSRHLALLRESGWLVDRREGPWVYCRAEFGGWGADLRQAWDALLRARQDDPERRHDRERLERTLRRRREAARRVYDGAVAADGGTRQSRLGDLLPWRSLAGLLPSDRVVVDLGTGTGDLLPYAAPRAARVVAVDFSAVMLGTARERMRAAPGSAAVDYVRGDLEDLPLADGIADGVVASLVLHHAAQPAVAIREMARILRPGGRLVLVDFLPHGEEWLKEEEGDVWLGFEPATVRQWLEHAGFGRLLVEDAPPPTSSGRRDRPGADRRLKRMRLLWVEAEKRPARPVITRKNGDRNGPRKVQRG